MTTYTFTSFKNRGLTAKSQREETTTYDESADKVGFTEAAQAIRDWERNHAGKALYWSGSKWIALHRKEDWQATAQITLECDRSKYAALLNGLANTPWHYVVSETVGDKGDGVLVQIPLQFEITDSDLYTRFCSILAKQMGINGWRPGCDTVPYLWQWDLHGGSAYERPQQGHLIDAHALRELYKGQRIVFSDYVGDKTPPALSPPPITDANDLFMGGGF